MAVDAGADLAGETLAEARARQAGEAGEPFHRPGRGGVVLDPAQDGRHLGILWPHRRGVARRIEAHRFAEHQQHRRAHEGRTQVIRPAELPQEQPQRDLHPGRTAQDGPAASRPVVDKARQVAAMAGEIDTEVQKAVARLRVFLQRVVDAGRDDEQVAWSDAELLGLRSPA